MLQPEPLQALLNHLPRLLQALRIGRNLGSHKDILSLQLSLLHESPYCFPDGLLVVVHVGGVEEAVTAGESLGEAGRSGL